MNVKPIFAILTIQLPTGETITIWPDDDLAQHVLIEIQQGNGVWRRMLSELNEREIVNGAIASRSIAPLLD